MSKTTQKRVLILPTKPDSGKIRKTARANPDALSLTATQFNAMVSLRSLTRPD